MWKQIKHGLFPITLTIIKFPHRHLGRRPSEAVLVSMWQTIFVSPPLPNGESATFFAQRFLINLCVNYVLISVVMMEQAFPDASICFGQDPVSSQALFVPHSCVQAGAKQIVGRETDTGTTLVTCQEDRGGGERAWSPSLPPLQKEYWNHQSGPQPSQAWSSCFPPC